MEKLNSKNEHLIEVFKEQIAELKEEIEQQAENIAPKSWNIQTSSSLRRDEIEKYNIKIRDLEQSNKILRKTKNAFKMTSEVKCSLCFETFKPVIFKTHILECEQSHVPK